MSTLTQRYLTAVARAIPESQRADVEEEVAAAIDELTEARLAAGEAPGKAEHAVLLELGDPMRLAADYANKPLHLIGPDHFPSYIRLLKVLAATVLPIVTVIVFLAKLLSDADAGEVAATTITTLLSLATHVFFWVTIVFAAIERSPGSKNIHPRWDPAMLPDVPQGKVRLGDTLAAVLVALGGVAYIVWQHFYSPFTGADGRAVPTLNAGLWSLWIPVLMAALLAGAVVEILRYRAGGWSWPFVAVNAALDLAFSVPLVWLASTNALLEPRFVQRLVEEGWTDASMHLNVSVIVLAVGIAVWDVIDSALKVRRDTAARGARTAGHGAVGHVGNAR